VLRAAQDAEMSWETIASVLELPSAALAEEHFRQMVKRESELIDPPRHYFLSDQPAAPDLSFQRPAEDDSDDES
jgi:hypothetical protein